MMNQMLDMERLHYITSLLSSELPNQAEDVPAEVAEALNLARLHMQSIPDAIDDLAAAQAEFKILSKALERLHSLTRQGMEVPEDDQAGREAMETELVDLARVVARVAGQEGYDRPEILSVRTRAQAKASHQIMSRLNLVQKDLAARLVEQECLIVEAIDATIDFLEAVAQEFPQTATRNSIPDLLSRVRCVREASRPLFISGPAAEGGIH